MADLFSMLDGMNDQSPESREEIVRAPFPYTGSKYRSLKQILPQLPHTGVYVEPFGGSAAILLARRPSVLEVFNDRYAGVVAFYRCIRDKAMMNQLCERLEVTIHSREEFLWTRDTWENCDDLVERAARWYYMTKYSFASLGRNFGRSLTAKALLGNIQDRLPLFSLIHERFKHVQVENQDCIQCLLDYDSHDTVFYIDPPYLDADTGIYKNKMSEDAHRKLLNTIFALKGFCAVSGYSNPIYDDLPWDNKHQWDTHITVKSEAYTESNNKDYLKGLETRGTATECLWIKEGC